MVFSPKKRKTLTRLYIEGKKLKTVDSTKYLGVTIDNTLSWTPHINQKLDQCSTLLKLITRRTSSYFGPKPKLMRWVYTGIIRPKFTYGALVWAHSITPKQHKKLKQLNRLACMSLTPTTRSTPQAALEILYNISPLDLHLTEIGLKTFLRLKSQLDSPKYTQTAPSHLSYWDSLQVSAEPLWQTDDSCNEAMWFKQYRVNRTVLADNKNI